MREALVYMHGKWAGRLRQENSGRFQFTYLVDYEGPPISLTMPVRDAPYVFDHFPPFFDGLLPEGWQLEALLRQAKLDRTDYLGQLLMVGQDLVGAVTVSPAGEKGNG